MSFHWTANFRPRKVECRYSDWSDSYSSVSLGTGCECGVSFAEKATRAEIGIDEDAGPYLLVTKGDEPIVFLTEASDGYSLAQLASWLGHNMGLSTPRVTFRSNTGQIRNGESLLLDLKFYKEKESK